MVGWAARRALYSLRASAPERQASQAAAGNAHAMVRTTDGAVFTFGSGSQGQLGHGDFQERLLPTRVMAAEELERAPSPLMSRPLSPFGV